MASARKIAIVGSGVAGLVAAHYLHRRHDVTVFEADDRIGGHVNTIPVEVKGRVYPVDVGFVVYNERNYPRFSALLAHLGVKTLPTDMSFSVRAVADDIEYNGGTFRGLFVQPMNACRPKFLRMLIDVLRFNRDVRDVPAEESEPLGGFLDRGRYSRGLREWYLLPMMGCIWSVPRAMIAEFPLGPLASFLRNHGLLDLWGRPVWRVVEGGAARYAEALAQPFRERLRLHSPVRRVCRGPASVRVELEGGNGGEYDHVVLALHGDRVLDLLGDATLQEREVFSRVRYVENELVVHTDAGQLPARERTRACWNATVTPDATGPIVVTYYMNRLQRFDAAEPICVSLNPAGEVIPSKVVRRLHYRHPVLTPDATAIKGQIRALSGRDRVHFCGAYVGYGFHEDGVVSAIEVARDIDAAVD